MKNKILLLIISVINFVQLCAMDNKNIEIKVMPKFSDLKLVPFSDEEDNRYKYFLKSWYWYYKGDLVASLGFPVYKIQPRVDAIRDFIHTKLVMGFSRDAQISLKRLVADKLFIVELESLKVTDIYQKQGLGKDIMRYFLNYVKNTYGTQVIILLEPVPSFDLKGEDVKLLKSDLYQKLIKFYKNFGAQEIPNVDKWLYIDLK